MYLMGCGPSEADKAVIEGNKHTTAGEYEKAKDSFRRALSLYGDMDKPAADQGRLLTLMKLAVVCYLEADYGEALGYAERAKDVYRNWNGDVPVAVSLHGAATLANLGSIYTSLGSYDNALAYCKEAKEDFDELFSSIKWKPQGADTLVEMKRVEFMIDYNLGVSFRNVGDIESSLASLDSALKNADEIAQTKVRSQIALTHLEKGDLSVQPDIVKNVTSLVTLGVISLRSQDYEKAIEHLSDALSSQDVLRSNELLFVAHTGLAIAYEATGQTPDARRNIDSAVKLAESIESKCPPEHRDTFLSKVHGLSRKDALTAHGRIIGSNPLRYSPR